MSHPQTLTGLTEREAIADAMYRVIIGFDHNDVPMFNSAFADNDVVLVFKGTEIKGVDTIKAQMLDLVGPMATTHMISNVRVNLKEGAKTASLTAYALAQHCPPGTGEEAGGPKYLAGSEYFIDVLKDEADGVWKIRKWTVNVIWTQGDASVMQRAG